MDRRIQKTKAAIRQAFFSLLLDNSNKKLNVAQIARIANIDRKTFYLHYDSVEAIFTEFSQEKIDELENYLKESGFFEEPLNPQYLMASLNRLLMEDLDFYRNLSRIMDTFDFWEKVQSLLVKTIVQVYKESAQVPYLELEMHAQYFASGILTLYLRWLQDDNGMTLEQLGRISGEIAAFGLVHLFHLSENDLKNNLKNDEITKKQASSGSL